MPDVNSLVSQAEARIHNHDVQLVHGDAGCVWNRGDDACMAWRLKPQPLESQVWRKSQQKRRCRLSNVARSHKTVDPRYRVDNQGYLPQTAHPLVKVTRRLRQ